MAASTELNIILRDAAKTPLLRTRAELLYPPKDRKTLAQ
jgi:hypothetical protein